MPSFLNFYLNLEANAEVITPQYTTTDGLTHIRIVSDDPMVEISDIKLVDSLGGEHFFPSQNPDSTEYDMEIILTDYPLGITTFHATIRDTEGNTKVLTPKSFEIYKATVLFVTVSDSKDYAVPLSNVAPFRVLLSDKGRR
jgi:hypothetical protein